MKLQDVSNFAGLDGFCWFVGQVEARVVTIGEEATTQLQFDEDGEMKIYIQINKFLNDALEYLKNDNNSQEK